MNIGSLYPEKVAYPVLVLPGDAVRATVTAAAKRPAKLCSSSAAEMEQGPPEAQVGTAFCAYRM